MAGGQRDANAQAREGGSQVPEASGVSVRLDERSRSAIEIDPELARLRKHRRQERLNRFLIPRLRILGFALLGVAVFLHNRIFATADSDEAALVFTTSAVTYALLVWAGLHFLYKRLLPFDLSFAFLVTDLFFLTAAIYASGGEASWLAAILLLRTADQTSASFRRTVFFAHATVVAYLLLIAYLAWGEGRPIFWSSELLKALLLYFGNLYILTAGHTSQIRRRKLSATIEMARDALRRLEANAAELEGERARAEAASRSKSQFLAQVSHEIRSPMNELLGISDMLLLEELTEEQRKWIKILSESGGHLLSVVDDMLDYSNIEAGEMVLSDGDCDVRHLAEGMVRLLQPRAESKGVELTSQVDAEVPKTVRVDSLRLGQVLRNLVGNAVKLTESGRVVLQVGVEEVIDASRVRLRFSVEDTGIGIPPENHAYLFEPFARAGASLEPGQGGPGLGLPISQRLLELMGGEIEVDSTPGEGSRFSFVLPLDVVDDAAPSPAAGAPAAGAPAAGPPAAAEAQPSAKPGSKARVLLVEDEEVSRLVAHRLLQSLGLEVVAVQNGREALDAIGDEPFDVVVMDCQMPVMDGYEATREIRRREGSERHTPIVALTAHALTGDRDRCLAAGMDDYVPKPVGRGVLADVLSAWVEIEDSP